MTTTLLEPGIRPTAPTHPHEPSESGVASVQIATDLCKGCWLCVHACPEKCLGMSKEINRRGYRFATYAGAGCTGCGVCFYTCPEPATLTVFRGSKTSARPRH